MEEKIAVSVIVPAYNAGNVLGDCLESLLKQKLKELEIIIINDGSKDLTGEIARGFAKKDPRIRIIDKQQNEGLSAGRNSGMEIARGEYIGFVDADDWVEEDYFEVMYAEGAGTDLIVTGYQHDTMDEERKELYISRKVSMSARHSSMKKEIVSIAADVDTAKMFAYTWNKLYKRTIIEENNLQFSQQVLIEDFIFNTLYWDKIQSVCITEGTGYHYVKASKEALTQKFLPDFVEIMDKRFDYMKKLMVQNEVYHKGEREKLANVYIKHALAGVARNCSPEGHYSFGEQYRKVKSMFRNIRSIEACTNAKGVTSQEKVCNLIFKSRIAIAVWMFGKLLHIMQTSSKTAFDKLK